MAELTTLILLGMALILIGFFVIFAGVLLAASKAEKGRAEAGGALIVGPFPIVFGTSTKALVLTVVAAIALLAIALILLLLFRKALVIG